jgi:fibronectin type III domain protein
MTATRSIPACALVAILSACGGAKNPVGPEPKPSGPAVPAAPTGLRIASLDTATRSAVIQWDPTDGAERYVVERWDTFDTSVTITSVTTNGPETSVTLRDLPGDWLSVRVRASNSAGVGAPSMPPVMLQIPVTQDVVEALFFGTGPYGSGLFAEPGGDDSLPASINQAHAQPGTMLGWNSGTILVRVEDAATGEQMAYLNAALSQLTELTGGLLRFDVIRGPAMPNFFFVRGEYRVMMRDDLRVPCSTLDQSLQGCAPQSLAANGEIIAALTYVKSNGNPAVVTHELGHALLGLHHVTKVVLPERPIMSASVGNANPGFSTLETEAIRAVYRAGLRFGASREDFQAKGLIH